jgi:hypothetical protein
VSRQLRNPRKLAVNSWAFDFETEKSCFNFASRAQSVTHAVESRGRDRGGYVGRDTRPPQPPIRRDDGPRWQARLSRDRRECRDRAPEHALHGHIHPHVECSVS